MSLADATNGSDILRSLKLWKLWSFIGWQDVRQRYRGSVLGPFWIAGSVGVITLGAGSLYASLLKTPSNILLPFICISISLWLFISLTILECCQAFLVGAPLIRNTNLPLGIHVLRAIYRNLIVFAHNVPVVLLVFLLYRFTPSVEALWAVPGFLILLANVAWMGWIAALLSARYPDVGQMIGFALQFALFVTPVFWRPEQAGRGHPVLIFNPFNHLLAIVRGPIMGVMPGGDTWLIAIVMAIAGLAVAAIVHRRLQASVVFWL